MQETIQSFTDYLQTEKKASKNTEVSYQRDLRKLAVFLKEHGIEKPEQMNATVLNSYLLYLEREHFSPATISRSIAAIHMFCQYACQEGKMVSDPSKALQPPRVERKMPEILSIAEVDLLLRQPKTDTPKGIRDKAMLEMLYATGIRVSELQYITIEAVKCGEAVVNCKSKTRSVFIIKKLKQKLLRYAAKQGIKSGMIFVTKSGKPINRTNIWREMKSLCKDANVNSQKVFPHNLRHLFARTFYGIEKDIAKLADILGHSSIDTTRIYIISTGTEHRRRMENMHLII